MYTDCAGSGLLPNFDASARQPVRLAIRETDGRPEITKVAMDPINETTQETSSEKITDDKTVGTPSLSTDITRQY